jgi:TolA-binding protein
MSARRWAFVFAALWLASTAGWAATYYLMRAKVTASEALAEERREQVETLQREAEQLPRWKARAEKAEKDIAEASEAIREHIEQLRQRLRDRGQDPDKAPEDP